MATPTEVDGRYRLDRIPDGLPKVKDVPAAMGGSGALIAE